jgi:hypothetical protein
MRVSSNKILQKYDHTTSHYVVILLSAQHLSDSNFPEAARDESIAWRQGATRHTHPGRVAESLGNEKKVVNK